MPHPPLAPYVAEKSVAEEVGPYVPEKVVAEKSAAEKSVAFQTPRRLETVTSLLLQELYPDVELVVIDFAEVVNSQSRRCPVCARG